MTDDIFEIPIVKISLMPLKVVALMMVLLPGYGLWDAFDNQISLLGVSIDADLLSAYLGYVLLMSIVVWMAPSAGFVMTNPAYLFELKRISFRGLLISCVCFFEIFWISGQHTVSGAMDRGEVRASLGIIGPFYNFTVKYLLALLALLATYNLILGRDNKTQNYLALVLVVFSALMTGYKATLIMVLLPSSCLLWPLASAQQKALLFLVAFSAMVCSSMFFSNISLEDARRYVAARATTVAAYGVAGSWDYAQSYAVSIINEWVFDFFGNNISQLIFDTFNVNFQGAIKKLITVNYYPNVDRAEDGSVNLTLTLFGELVSLFGGWWFLIVILFGAGFIKFFKFTLALCVYGDFDTAILGLIFITFVVLPTINSGGIFTIIALPTAINITLVYFCLRLIVFRGDASFTNQSGDDTETTDNIAV